jgi:type II secretory pathway pseudopilin PulG
MLSDQPPPAGEPNAPSGWYDDPLGSGNLRYWDGQQWTERITPAEETAERPLATPPKQWPSGWDRIRAMPTWLKVVSGIFAGLLLIGLLAPDDKSSQTTTTDTAAAAAAAAQQQALEQQRQALLAQKRRLKRQRVSARRAKQRAQQAARRARAADRAQAAAAARSKPKPQPALSNCDPNYSGCVPPYPPDVDCSDVNGPVTVTGSDPHELDADGDGVACDIG